MRRTIGDTVQRREIECIEFGNGPKMILVIAGLHPLEWIGVAAAHALIDRVQAREGWRIAIVPIVNVDGYRAVEDDLRVGRRKFRRTNARGVDLNRNWPTGHRAKKKHGMHPRSEPEVDAVCRLVDDHVRAGGSLELALSLHSFGNKLLVPWGKEFGRAVRYRELATLAEVLRSRLAEPYDVVQASHWLPGAMVRGCELDHFYGTYGARSILVECGRGGITWDPRSWIAPWRWYNPPDMASAAADIARAIVALCETIMG